MMDTGVVIWEQEKIKDRWKSYFEMLLNEENPRTVFEDGVQNEGVTPGIERREVKVALQRAKKGRRWDRMEFQWRFGSAWERKQGPATEDLWTGENAAGVTRQCHFTDIQKEMRHPGV